MLVQPFANQAQCATGHSKAEMVVKVACEYALFLLFSVLCRSEWHASTAMFLDSVAVLCWSRWHVSTALFVSLISCSLLVRVACEYSLLSLTL